MQNCFAILPTAREQKFIFPALFFFLPACVTRFAGEPMIFYYNIKSAQFSKDCYP